MRPSLALVIAVASSVLAQDLGPSPTASVGCEPHGDHWHCDGPATDMSATATSITSAATPTVPSPTASVGCEPHGDHWHCDGPASTDDTDSSDGNHSHSEGDQSATATPTVPSPTASVGCEPHGDHWHCDGPVETGESNQSGSSTSDSAAASSTGPQEDGTGRMAVQLSAVVGLAMAVAALNA